MCFKRGKPGHFKRDCPRATKPGKAFAAAPIDTKNLNMFHIHGKIRGNDVAMLLDTGSSRNFCSAKLGKTLGTITQVSDDSDDVELLGGQVLKPMGRVTVERMEIEAMGLTHLCLAMQFLIVKEMPKGIDLILSAATTVSSGLLQKVMDAARLHTSAPATVEEDLYEEAESSAEAAWLAAVLNEYKEIFDGALPPGGAQVPPMPIKLKPGFTPPKEPLRVYSKSRADALDQLVEKGLDDGVFVRGTSAASSPPHVFPKPGEPGRFRMTIDFRKLNVGVEPINFPMPNVEKSIEALAGFKYYCKIDLREGYHQIPIREEDQWITGFVTRQGAFRYTRVPMGLTTAPHYFQSVMMQLLQKKPGVVVFVDDVIVGATQDNKC